MKRIRYSAPPPRPGLGLKKSSLLLALALLAGCEKPQAPPPPQAPVVEVAQVEQRNVPVYQEWVGTLDGMVNAQILAQVSGYLIKQYYHEGQPVKKGDLLYEIDPRTFQATLDQAIGNLARQEAVLKTAKLDLDRIQRLLPQNAVSVRDRDNAMGKEASAEAQVLAAKAAVENARLELGFTKIISPIDGIAGKSQAQLGDLVGPGGANPVLTTVSQVNPIKAFIPLTEQQYLGYAMDRENGGPSHRDIPLELMLVDGSTYPHPGKFFFADRQVNLQTGTIKVAILFDNPGNVLRPGQFARIRAQVKMRNGALLVPQRAVSEVQGKHLVAVVKPDNTVSLRPVKTAETVGTMWVVEEGLKPGERVIAEGLQKVREGVKVNPKPFAEASPAAPATAR